MRAATSVSVWLRERPVHLCPHLAMVNVHLRRSTRTSGAGAAAWNVSAIRAKPTGSLSNNIKPYLIREHD